MAAALALRLSARTGSSVSKPALGRSFRDAAAALEVVADVGARPISSARRLGSVMHVDSSVGDGSAGASYSLAASSSRGGVAAAESSLSSKGQFEGYAGGAIGAALWRDWKDAVPASAPARKAPARASEGGGRRRNQYPVPAAYTALLNGHTNGASEATSSTAPAEASASAGDDNVVTPGARRRDFWRSTRKTARQRLRDLLGPEEAQPWERRLAEMHESLWVEELNVSLELSRLRATADVLPRTSDGLYLLDVENLSDQTPGLLEESAMLRGVRLLVRCREGNEYWANVQPGSGGGTLLLGAPGGLEFSAGPYEVEFHPHRFQQVAMHRALDAPVVAGLLRGQASSSASEGSAAAAGEGRSTSSKEVEDSLPPSLNEGQRRAVAAVLEGSNMERRRNPLVIWGPPGTGKSTLAAFIIWHLVQQRPSDLHILAAAPSNTGADVLCRKLAKLGLHEDQMFRLNALGRSESTLPEELLKYCRRASPTAADSKAGSSASLRSFVVPPLQELRKFKVVVATCVSAAHIANALQQEGAAVGWFSHVVVDEAGEATEPETLVPLSLLRPAAGSAVLLGDHFQLGPLVLSKLASQLSALDIPMIERLANDRFVTATQGDGDRKEDSGLCKDALGMCEDHGLHFLTESYRSHIDIMSLFSKLFYGDQLEHRERPHQSELMPFFVARGLSAPVVLHNVIGRERRDSDSPSLYNLEEVRLVFRYVEELLEDEGLGLKGEDIGIITPYVRQRKAVQTQLDSIGGEFSKIDCGTVEKFQGQERKVIILSTVRCSNQVSASEEAKKQPIGFMADPKRLNVSISRAVAGLIVVGDLNILATHSQQWRRLLQMGQELQAVRGQPLDVAAAGTAVAAARPAAGKKKAAAVPTAEASQAWNALTGP
eukprot:TRINITY_DN10140_c0_g1_i2.p1 TRINITY_DN10140_c0_g1~~TRINITY_DN10140_c0_g1_i2.p1  ORF type:complete len:889 (-),score=226.96 TRINITY_DN10140_c0_g1_i2:372-3038(-)